MQCPHELLPADPGSPDSTQEPTNNSPTDIIIQERV